MIINNLTLIINQLFFVKLLFKISALVINLNDPKKRKTEDGYLKYLTYVHTYL